MTGTLVYTKQAQKDAKKLASSGLKPKAQELLALIAEDPYRKSNRLKNSLGILPEPIRAGSISSIGWFIKCSKVSEW